MEATPEMRQVNFGMWDRLAITPVEMVQFGKYLLILLSMMILLSGITRDGYSTVLAARDGLRASLFLFLAYLGGGLVTPTLLPWIPGKAFSTQGALTGGIVTFFCLFCLGPYLYGSIGLWEVLSWIFLMPAVAAFIAMNYTGNSTYTSLSGVLKEMKYAVPLQITGAVLGLGFWLTSRAVSL